MRSYKYNFSTRISVRPLSVFSLLFTSVIAHAEPIQKVVTVATLTEAHEVGGLEFGADTSQLVVMAGAYDRRANVWDWRTRNVVSMLPNAHASPMVSVSGRISPNGQLFVHCGSVVTVWNAHTWQVRQVVDNQTSDSMKGGAWPGNCQSIEFSPDGDTLVVLRDRPIRRGGPTVSAYDTASWAKRWSVETEVFYPKSLAFAPDGKQVAVGGAVSNIKSWRGHTTMPTFGDPPLPDTGLIAILDLEKQAFVRIILVPETTYASTQSVVWQGLHNTLSYGAEQAIRTFDASSGVLLHIVPTESQYGRPAAFLSPDGRVQVETGFGPKGQLIRIVDVATGARKVLREVPAQVRAVAWSRDSRYFALGGAAFSIGSALPIFELLSPSKGKVIVYEIR